MSEFSSPTVPSRASQRRRTPRQRRRAITYGILAGFVGLVLLLGLDAVLSARRMLSGLNHSRLDLVSATDSVVTGDPLASRPVFISAGEAADSAIAAAGHPSMKLLGALPWVGENIDAVRAVAQASHDTAQAGLTMADAAIQLGWTNILLPGTASLGDVDLKAIRTAAPKVASVSSQLHEALVRLDEADSSKLLGPVRAGFDDARKNLARRAALALDARTLMRATSALFGGGQPKRYLVAVQSLGVPQPPGGRLGPVGVLTADAGRLTLSPLTPADAAVAGTLSSPDVPSTGPAMLSTAGSELGPLDGMIVVDTIGLQDLLWMVGDVELTGEPSNLSQNDTVETLEQRVFLGTNAGEAEAQQARVAGDAMAAALTRRPSTEAFATAAAQMVNGRHLAIYSADPKTQARLAALGATGSFDPRANTILVSMDGQSNSRTGSYARLITSINITLDETGNAKTKTIVELQNQAPDAPPSVLLGQRYSAEKVGSFSADTSIYLPQRAKKVKVETSSPSATSVTEALGVPVATALLSADSGGDISMIVGAFVTSVADPLEDGYAYRLVVVQQPSVVLGTLRVHIQVPDGNRILSAVDTMTVGGTTARYEGIPAGPMVFWVRYHPA